MMLCKHPILSKHVPPSVLQGRSVRVQMSPEEDYADADAAAGAKQLMEAGVPVSIGGHGQREGLASHWEMWSFSRGGMSPLQVLQTATTEPARHLGFDKDIGTLEKGKLADLVILSFRTTHSMTFAIPTKSNMSCSADASMRPKP